MNHIVFENRQHAYLFRRLLALERLYVKQPELAAWVC